MFFNDINSCFLMRIKIRPINSTEDIFGRSLTTSMDFGKNILVIKAIKGEKDDNKDAKWIADLFKLGLVRSSFIPEKDIRILRELTRYPFKLINTRSSEKNRFQNALTVGNCKVRFQ